MEWQNIKSNKSNQRGKKDREPTKEPKLTDSRVFNNICQKTVYLYFQSTYRL